MLLARVATDNALVLVATADDEGRLLRAAVFRAQEQGLVHVVASFLEGDGDAALDATVICASPLSRLSECIVNAFASLYTDFTSEGSQLGSYQDGQ